MLLSYHGQKSPRAAIFRFESNEKSRIRRKMAPRSWWTSAAFLLTGYVLSTCVAQDYTTHEEQEEYLKQFAYLGGDTPDPHMQELRDDPERQFQLAIQNFQRFAGLNVTGIVDADTIRMMKAPRCGVRDVESMGSIARRRKRYAASRNTRWGKLHLTYRFINYSPDLARDTIRSVFQQAFKMWSDVSSLSFSEVTGRVSDIEISFVARSHGDGNAFDGPGSTLAHAYFPSTAPIGGDAHFDEDETWTHGSNQGTNLLQVAVHELGHSLGLGHSDVQTAIMAPFYSGYKPNFRLDRDDIAGIRYLYGHGGSGGGPPTTMGPRPTTTPSYGTVPPTMPPDYCPLAGFCRHFDAIEVISDTIYAFKGPFVARLSRYGAIVDVRRIQDRWPKLPNSLDTVMATSRYVYFFKGSEYWRMDKTIPGVEGNAWTKKRIRDGFPRAPDNLDAAFIWSGNGRIYFIKGGLYYRYRGRHGVDPEYPLPLRYWKNVRSPVDDAFQYQGATYFFSGTGYQIFDDTRFVAGYPRSTTDLMQCCTRQQEQLAAYVSGGSDTTTDSSATALKFASLSQLGFMLLLVSFVSALV